MTDAQVLSQNTGSVKHVPCRSCGLMLKVGSENMQAKSYFDFYCAKCYLDNLKNE